MPGQTRANLNAGSARRKPNLGIGETSFIRTFLTRDIPQLGITIPAGQLDRLLAEAFPPGAKTIQE